MRQIATDYWSWASFVASFAGATVALVAQAVVTFIASERGTEKAEKKRQGDE